MRHSAKFREDQSHRSRDMTI